MSQPSLRYWITWLWRHVYQRDEWLLIRHRLGEGPPAPGPLPEGCRMLRGTDLLLGYPEHPGRTERIRQRLEDPRQHGMGLAQGGGLVYDTWIWIGSYSEPRTGILLDPGSQGGVLLDSWTVTAQRGRGLHAAMLLRRLEESHRLGLRTLDGLVHLRNAPALAAQRGAGAEALKRYVCRRVLGLRHCVTKQASWDELDSR